LPKLSFSLVDGVYGGSGESAQIPTHSRASSLSKNCRPGPLRHLARLERCPHDGDRTWNVHQREINVRVSPAGTPADYSPKVLTAKRAFE